MGKQVFDGREGSFGYYGGPNVAHIRQADESKAKGLIHGYWQTKCCLCGSKAIYYGGRHGFCRMHKAEAALAQKPRPISFILRGIAELEAE